MIYAYYIGLFTFPTLFASWVFVDLLKRRQRERLEHDRLDRVMVQREIDAYRPMVELPTALEFDRPGPLLITEQAQCPICRTLILDGTSLVLCGSCKLLHHESCYRDNGSRCAAYACGGCGEAKISQHS